MHIERNITNGVSFKKGLLPDPRFRQNNVGLTHKKLYVLAIFITTSSQSETQINNICRVEE